MGCFLGCFGSGDDRRRKPKKKSLPRSPSRRNYESLQPVSELEAPPLESPTLVISENREKQENLSFNSRKKVTFDLDVNTYIEASATDVLDGEVEKEEDTKSEEQNQPPLKDSSTQSNQILFPENHRYQNCVIGDDEEVQEEEDEDDDVEDEDYEDSDLEDCGGEEEEEEPEVSQESCFSLPLDGERKFDPISEAERENISPRTISTATAPGVRDRSQYVHSVLNPVENLSQWKAVKAKPTTGIRKPKKENIHLDDGLELPPFTSEEPTFKYLKPNVKLEANDYFTPPPPKPAIAVDASLSNWLSPSQATKTDLSSVDSTERSGSQTSYSSRMYEDRPILGALTVEQIKSSASPLPRRSPSRSPDDIPILGTVGSYWSHQRENIETSGIPNTTSKYREDKRVTWHSTPFQERLERSLNREAAES